MSSTVILKASGLYTSPNNLSIPEGALSEASNVVIRRDNIIEQRRGFSLYGNSAGTQFDTVKNLTVYRDRLLRHVAEQLQYDSDGNGEFLSFTGTFVAATNSLRMKFVEASGNLFFTSSNGVQKLSAKTAAQFEDNMIKPAGAAKAIDLEANINYIAGNQTGFLPQDSAVSYRILWAYKDNNNNLIQGAPSQRELVYFRQIDFMLQDYMRFLGILDSFTNTPLTTARINDKNYVNTLGLESGAGTSDLRSKLIALTEKLDNDILIANQTSAPLVISSASVTSGLVTVTFSSGTPSNYFSNGSKIFLSGFNPTAGVINGARTVASVTDSPSKTITFNVDVAVTGPITLSSATINSNEFRSLTQPPTVQIPPVHIDNTDVQTYFSDILNVLRNLPVDIISSSDQALLDPFEFTTTATVELTVTIPQDIDDRYFYQIYRSAIFAAADTQSIDDVIPNDELQLVYEAYPTPSELEVGQLVVADVTPDDFRGANLYTNNATGEGILQSNEPPPFALDINRYRNVVFYANTRTKHKLLFNLLGVQNMINDYDSGTVPSLTIATTSGANTYKFVTGQQEIVSIATVADVSNSLNGKYFLLDSTSGSKFYVWFSTGTGIDPMVSGRTGIKVLINTNETANNVALKLKDRLSIYIADFIVSVSTNIVEVANVEFGETKDSQDVDTGFTLTITQQGRGETVLNQISQVVTVPASDFVNSGPAEYFQLATANNKERYYFWFKVGTSVDPALGSGKISKPIELSGTETDSDVASLIAAQIPSDKFKTEVSGNTITIENIQAGECDNISENVADLTFSVSTIQEGKVEVLLSTNPSPAIAVDETARSLIRVINRNDGESVYGYYLSGAFDVPGKMLIEARNLEVTSQFFIVANNSITGASFNPDISPQVQISSITTGANPVITTSQPHGLQNLDFVVIGNTNCEPLLDGIYAITYISPTQFSVDKYITVAGTQGTASASTNTTTSENEVKPNRIYYSKFLQPEAVPAANFFDVGAEDKPILRIFPLRDSLFVFKEDGTYRISGETSPFQLDLFDSSLIVTAPDSVNVCNNVIFAWTTQGIQTLTEGGAQVISRSIDNLILKLGSNNYTNFKTATFGVGYESDNSYLVWTVKDFSDEIAQVAFRFSTLTQSWTTYDKTNTCGIVNPADDKLYLGAGDTNYLEKERKSFDRTDYSDREFNLDLANNFRVSANLIKVSSITNLSLGDVIAQNQTLTTFEFNTMLEKLDNDPSVGDNNYLSTLQISNGSNPRNALLALATKLDNDPNIVYSQFLVNIDDYLGLATNIAAGTNAIITSNNHGLITGRVVEINNSNSTPSIDGTYTVTVIDSNRFSINRAVKIPGTTCSWGTIGLNTTDLKNCYNFICEKLNLDNGVSFNNYRPIDNDTLMEVVITNINPITRQVTVNLDLELLVGEVTVYKAITSSITYLPTTMGDPLQLKHLREATLMFEQRNITGGTLSFASDLMPEFIEIPFKLDGNGIFGHQSFGSGYFGGLSNSAPFRTYIPRQCQRCRYLVAKFTHSTAREDYRLLGMTITGNVGLSTRAYR